MARPAEGPWTNQLHNVANEWPSKELNHGSSNLRPPVLHPYQVLRLCGKRSLTGSHRSARWTTGETYTVVAMLGIEAGDVGEFVQLDSHTAAGRKGTPALPYKASLAQIYF